MSSRFLLSDLIESPNHIFIQQIIFGYQVCAMDWSRYWGCCNEKPNQATPLQKKQKTKHQIPALILCPSSLHLDLRPDTFLLICCLALSQCLWPVNARAEYVQTRRGCCWSNQPFTRRALLYAKVCWAEFKFPVRCSSCFGERWRNSSFKGSPVVTSALQCIFP